MQVISGRPTHMVRDVGRRVSHLLCIKSSADPNDSVLYRWLGMWVGLVGAGPSSAGPISPALGIPNQR